MTITIDELEMIKELPKIDFTIFLM